MSPGPHDLTACPICVDGDVNSTGAVTSPDVILLVNYMVKGGVSPLPCNANSNVNCDGVTTSADIIYLVHYVVRVGSAPCDICSGSSMPGPWRFSTRPNPTRNGCGINQRCPVLKCRKVQ
jgi:hypothetical protein